MAEEKKKVAGGGGSKLMLIVIVLLIILIVAVGGLGAYLYLSKDAASGNGTQTSQPAKKKPEGPPIFEKMDTFVVNLAGNTGALLQVEMQAQLIDAEAKKTLLEYMPKIRSGLILLLSSKSADELASADGKVRLKAQVKKIMNESIDLPGQEPVDSVVFTSFIIQNQ
ncbi:flagellar basal body-associated FliL family protein [Craterilacuibacter sp.]|uniref:flagellar basal body-associated FliL family protein n=1 Tax=Craterilacuibacter sp. TaxID=2870909 RepID=UPI003F3B29EB